jgi:hypothetical protein
MWIKIRNGNIIKYFKNGFNDIIDEFERILDTENLGFIPIVNMNDFNIFEKSKSKLKLKSIANRIIGTCFEIDHNIKKSEIFGKCLIDISYEIQAKQSGLGIFLKRHDDRNPTIMFLTYRNKLNT